MRLSRPPPSYGVAMLATHPLHVREEDFLARPPSAEREELLDGQIVVSPSGTWRHQEVLRRLLWVLQAWCDRHPPHHPALAPLDVRFGPGRILQPDAMVLASAPPLDAPTPLTVVPRLCVEVLSSDVDRDRHTRRLVYADAGVPEYWVVDPLGSLEVFTGPRLGTCLAGQGVVASPTLHGLVVDVTALTR
ncbi:MAG: Uma2 family endonuclease [Alphaproteobacteria bacterium]|nr:Uma2 family endonuclease [Alphaproteobacteria bacterium]